MGEGWEDVVWGGVHIEMSDSRDIVAGTACSQEVAGEVGDVQVHVEISGSGKQRWR